MDGLGFYRIKEFMEMHDVCTYHLQVRDQVDENAFSTAGPLQITVIQMDSMATVFTVTTDQSGLIGLLRHIHQQGFVILSVHRDQ
jgi:hypothetical protein